MKSFAITLTIAIFVFSCKKDSGNSTTVLTPEITSISPVSAKTGDLVKINGKNFTTNSTVSFNDVNAQVRSLTPTEINAVVPTGTGTVLVKVENGSLKSNSVSFTYDISVNNTPTIVSLQSPTSMTGDTITITGNNFNAAAKLFFGTTEVNILSANATSLKAIIPVGSGTVKVFVKNSEAAADQSNEIDFKYATTSATNITIGGVVYKIDTLSYFKIGPGTSYMALLFSSPSVSTPIRAFLTTVDATNQYISMKPVIGRDSVSNNERPSAMAIRKSSSGNRYIAGTNSDFYNTTTIYPRNANMIDGVLGSPPDNAVITGSYYAGNAVFDAQKRMWIDAFTYSANATIGTATMPIDTINYYSMTNPNHLMFFNIYCGKTTGTNNNRTEVAITPVSGSINYAGETEMKVVAVYPNKGNNAVDNSVSILSGTGTRKAFLDQLNVNDVLKIRFTMTPRGGTSIIPYNMTGGRQIIMKSGNILPDFWNGDEKHPRTGIGYSDNGSKVYMCVIDGRSAIAANVLTSEMAQIMKYYGATDALNLDGGGSSTMYLDKIGTVNKPSDGSERAVVAGIFAVSSAPDDNQIVEIVPKQYTVRLAKGETLATVFYGVNKYGQVVNNNLTGVNLTGNGLGGVSGSTFIAGNTTAYGFIVARYNNLTTRIKVIIE